MKKKSIFKASFEESLNLEDDGFIQYQLKEQDKKVSKTPSNIVGYFKNALLYGVLTLIFPIGLNFLLFAFSIMLHSSDPKDLTIPISNHNFLTAPVYVIGLLIWLSFVLIGKALKPLFIIPYRTHFHVTTFLIWFVIEFDLATLGLALPFITTLGFFALVCIFLTLIYWMLRTEFKSLKSRMYGEVNTPTLLDKIAKGISIYGAGILGLGVIINYILKSLSINFSPSVTLFGLFICWIVMNIGIIAMLIFMEFPYFLYAYYKWKYPEEYRDWEGKSVEDWYGKRHRVGRKGGVAFQRLRFDLDAFDALQTQRRQPYLLVDTHRSQGDPALDARARDAVEPFLQITGQELVQPLALPLTGIDDKERVGGGFGAEVVGQAHDDGGVAGRAGS